MEIVDASEFEAGCLKLLDDVVRTGDSLVLTKNGQPVAVLAPYRREPATLVGLHSNSVDILSDIVSPLDEPWEAER